MKEVLVSNNEQCNKRQHTKKQVARAENNVHTCDVNCEEVTKLPTDLNGLSTINECMSHLKDHDR